MLFIARDGARRTESISKQVIRELASVGLAAELVRSLQNFVARRKPNSGEQRPILLPYRAARSFKKEDARKLGAAGDVHFACHQALCYRVHRVEESEL